MAEYFILGVVVILLVIALIIYFIFKVLEFVVRSVNLYEEIVMNQRVIIGLLSDGDVATDAVADAVAAEVQTGGPSEMIPIEDYSESNGIQIGDAIKKIKLGVLKGKKVDGKWYVG